MKQLNKILETFKTVAKHEQGIRKPNETGPEKVFKGNTIVSKKGNAPAESEASQEFVDDHEIKVTPDAAGNGDEVFKASNITTNDRKKSRHGYDAKESEAVNEMSKAQMAKREDIVKGMKKNLSSFKERYGKEAKSVMYATATKHAMKEDTQVDEAVDHQQKAKENVQFHHGQAMDYAKEINAMLGEYKKNVGKAEHIGDWHANDMAQVHANLRQAHDTLKYAVMGVTPPKAVAMKESVEVQEEEQKYDSILEAVRAHKEEQQLVEAYASIIESVYESCETEEQRQQLLDILESDDAFDQLIEIVESAATEGEKE
jgi:hypothetical protein